MFWFSERQIGTRRIEYDVECCAGRQQSKWKHGCAYQILGKRIQDLSKIVACCLFALRQCLKLVPYVPGKHFLKISKYKRKVEKKEKKQW